MATDFYTRSGGGRFLIVLETDRPEHYKFMQAAARICVDGKQADFAPVVHGWWETRKVIDGFPPQYHHFHNDPNCKYGYGDYNCVGHPYCPNCGAKMDAKDGASDEP